MSRKYLPLVASIVFLASCASSDINQVNNQVHKCTQIGCEENNFEVIVTSEFSKETDFTQFKTYAWIENSSLIFDSNHNWAKSDIDPVIEFKFAVDTEFRTKGLSQVSKNPDLIVAMSVGANADRIALHKLAKEQKTVIDDLPEGAALLIVAESDTLEVLYISLATGDVDQSISTQESQHRIKYVGQKLLEDYPR